MRNVEAKSHTTGTITKSTQLQKHGRPVTIKGEPIAKPQRTKHHHRNHTAPEDERHSGEEHYVKRLLARRAFHLPRHSWGQDWMQFMRNNHPVFGLCLHNPLHPLKVGHRMFIFIGSIAFGLTATNSVYLWYAYSNEDMDKILIAISLNNNTAIPIDEERLQITYGMVALWTFGGILHSLFDITMWFMTACICFLEGDTCGRFSALRSIGSYLTVAIVAVFVGMASFVVTMRAIYESRLEAIQEGIILNDTQWLSVIEFESFSFLLGFGVESLLVYCVYFPFFVTIGFSGVLQPLFRCFPCVRFLGGRPQEMIRQYEERKVMRKRGAVAIDEFNDEDGDMGP